jgi:hypothetical protein
MQVRFDFYGGVYYGNKPMFSSPEAKLDEGYAEKKAQWIDSSLRELGRVPPQKALSAQERNAHLKQVYKQKQEQLYCMRSVHLDKDG